MARIINHLKKSGYLCSSFILYLDGGKLYFFVGNINSIEYCDFSIMICFFGKT